MCIRDRYENRDLIVSSHPAVLNGFINQTRRYMEQEKESAEVTLTVSECGEFHNLGECYENIPTAVSYTHLKEMVHLMSMRI